MASYLAPQVRSEFAKRLKVMRTQRGFSRARYFASILGIEENRYTRYERAEVEPSLTLIHKICETLGITPNELLGFENLHEAHAGTGFSEPSSDRGSGKTDSREIVAWSLAEEIVRARRENDAGAKAADPLSEMRDIGGLFRSLLAEPFETVARLAEDPLLDRMSPRRKSDIANLMARLTSNRQGR